jgi:hypothetical protein
MMNRFYITLLDNNNKTLYFLHNYELNRLWVYLSVKVSYITDLFGDIYSTRGRFHLV